MEQTKEIQFQVGQAVKCGAFVGVLSWVDQTMEVITEDEKDANGKQTGRIIEKKTGKKTGDCRMVYLRQVPKGMGSISHGFDGVYFVVETLKVNARDLKHI
jgi:hypothetical protein